MAEIYNHYRSESFDHFVGHMSNDGVVYNHWQRESLTYAIGHVRNGVVYNDWQSESITHAIGHVGRNGVIYNHYDSESFSYAIGHVDSNGVVYDHWESESLSHAIGHVRGGSVYAAGAAFLLLNAGFNGPVVHNPPPMHEEEWRRERAEHEEEMKRNKNQRAIKAAKMQKYKNDPKIVAAAEEYARQRVKTATIFTAIFIALVCGRGFKNMSSEAVVPVLAILGLFALVVILFIRHMTYKDAFEKKVWELGEQGYSQEVPKQKAPEKKPTPKPTPKAKPQPTPKSEPKPKSVGSKIVTCPHCGTKCKIPVGVGTIEATCPNPSCNVKKFIIES